MTNHTPNDNDYRQSARRLIAQIKLLHGNDHPHAIDEHLRRACRAAQILAHEIAAEIKRPSDQAT